MAERYRIEIWGPAPVPLGENMAIDYFLPGGISNAPLSEGRHSQMNLDHLLAMALTHRCFRVPSACPRVTGLSNKAARRPENGAGRKGCSRPAGATIKVALGPRMDRFKTENRERYTKRRKWARKGMDDQSQYGETIGSRGVNPRCLASTKNRETRSI